MKKRMPAYPYDAVTNLYHGNTKEIHEKRSNRSATSSQKMDQKFKEPKTEQGIRCPSGTRAATLVAQTVPRTKCLALRGMLLTVIATINFISNSTGEGNLSRNVTLNVRKPATISRVSYDVG